MTGPSPKPLLDLTRRWFAVDVVVLAIAGIQCYVLATQTDRWFAWTVSPPLSAAVLGAGYLASIVMVVEARRARRLVDARIVLVGTFVFAALTLVVTLLHLDRFHFDTGGTAARAAAFAWLGVYVAVPVFVLWLVLRQEKVPGSEPARSAPMLSGPARAALAVEAALGVALGAVLFLGGDGIDFWPWALSDLTARAIAAWLIALGLMLLHCVREAELSRVRPPLHSIAAAVVLWLAALARFRDTVRWDAAGTVAVVALVVLLATAVTALTVTDRRVNAIGGPGVSTGDDVRGGSR